MHYLNWYLLLFTSSSIVSLQHLYCCSTHLGHLFMLSELSVVVLFTKTKCVYIVLGLFYVFNSVADYTDYKVGYYVTWFLNTKNHCTLQFISRCFEKYQKFLSTGDEPWVSNKKVTKTFDGSVTMSFTKENK